MRDKIDGDPTMYPVQLNLLEKPSRDDRRELARSTQPNTQVLTTIQWVPEYVGISKSSHVLYNTTYDKNRYLQRSQLETLSAQNTQPKFDRCGMDLHRRERSLPRKG